MDADPFDDRYDPKLLWLKSYNDKAPHASRTVRLRLPETLYTSIKSYLVGRPQTAWIDPQTLLRPAIYHGLHHLGKVMYSKELTDLAEQYRQAELVKELLAQQQAKQDMMQDLRQAERDARTGQQTFDLKFRLRMLVEVESDPEIKDELGRILERL